MACGTTKPIVNRAYDVVQTVTVNPTMYKLRNGMVVTVEQHQALIAGKPMPDVVEKPKLAWADRRPIGMIMLANYKEFTGTDNYMSEDFAATARNCIATMKDINAQGMIVWDAEGTKFPRPYTYYGDPKLTPQKVDTFFRSIAQAGLRTGVCVRPDSIAWVNGWPHHFVVADPYHDLVDKISYAKNRWGCTLFYVDSNVGVGLSAGTDNTIGAGRLMSANIFKRLNETFPDCLIIPEWHDANYDPHTALYWHAGWGTDMRAVSVVNTADTQWPVEHLKQAVDSGHILMGRVFWSSAPELKKIKQAYAQD